MVTVSRQLIVLMGMKMMDLAGDLNASGVLLKMILANLNLLFVN